MLERASGDLFGYEIAANRLRYLPHVLCSVPSHREFKHILTVD